jgi:hypothetical protein
MEGRTPDKKERPPVIVIGATAAVTAANMLDALGLPTTLAVILEVGRIAAGVR